MTCYDVTDAVGKQKLHKAAGPDGIQIKAFIYGCHRLHVSLSVLFNIFSKYIYTAISQMSFVVQL